jgi:hypothetical protein
MTKLKWCFATESSDQQTFEGQVLDPDRFEAP